MWTAEDVVADLRRRGELIEHAPGLTGLRGDTLALYRRLEERIALVAREETLDEWRVPQAISLATLDQARYFASFPHWLSAVAHLDGDDAALEEVASAAAPAEAAMASLRPSPIALPPAVCYHAFASLQGTTVESLRVLTAQGTCWRREAEGFAPLERQWAFTMREIVCAGNGGSVEEFRLRGIQRARAFAECLGLHAAIELATDPFFAPTARGRAILQRMKALKHELLLPIGGGRTIAAASFNNHERHFGEAFDIRLSDGTIALTGCVAFGIERWLLALLVEHGADPAGWPGEVQSDPSPPTPELIGAYPSIP